MTTSTVTPLRQATPRTPVLSSEWIKLWTLPSQRVLMLVAIGLAILTAIFFYVSLPITQGKTLGELDPAQILDVAILGVDAAAFGIIPLAAAFVGAEYSTNLMQTTLTLTPARHRIVLGKMSAIGILSFGVGLAAAVMCVLIALIAGATVGVAPGEILTPAGIQLAAGAILMAPIYGVIAVAGAFAFRSTAAGILIPLIVMAVGGLANWLGETVDAIVTPLMPVSALHTLEGIATGHQLLALPAAVFSLVAWAAAAVALSVWRMRRRDG